MKSDSEDKELETGTGEFVKADDAAEAEEQSVSLQDWLRRKSTVLLV